MSRLRQPTLVANGDHDIILETEQQTGLETQSYPQDAASPAHLTEDDTTFLLG